MSDYQKTKIGYYSGNLDGHRASYLEFVKSNFEGERLAAKQLFLHKGPVFFLMIEDNFALYFIVSIFRILIGKRTVGLLFRPKPAVIANSLRLKLKKLALKFLKLFSNVQTISIVPTTLEPKIIEIVDGWIYDFQLWDISLKQKKQAKEINYLFKQNDHIVFEKYKILKLICDKNKKNKKILIALGAQNIGKGTELLANSMNQINNADYFVVVAGKFSEDINQSKSIIENNGGLIFDRYISDDEILALYAISDSVWCFYDPSYDQASGILGRAIQFGIQPIVREGSISHLLCEQQMLNYVSVRNSDDIKLKLNNINMKYYQDSDNTEVYKTLSESTLRIALGLEE